MTQGRSWGAQNRGVIAALMGAAVIIIATGLNDMLAGAIPRYEPLYLYLAAVAIATWLSGVILGILSALIAIGFYGLLFMRRSDALSTEILIPVAAALGVVLVVGVIRGIVRSRTRVEAEAVYAPVPPMLATSAYAMSAPDNGEVLAAIDDLRNELRTAVTDANAARTRERNIEHEMAMSRESARIREEKLDRTYGEARDALNTRTRLLEVERDRTVQLLDDARARADRAETAARALPADYDQKLAAAAAEAATLASRVTELERSLSAEREHADAAEVLTRSAGDRAAEQEKAHHAERQRADAAQADAKFLVGRVAELEKSLAERERQLDRVSATGATQLAQVEGSIEELQRALDAERERADAEASEREKLKVEYDAKLQTLSIHLATDHEADRAALQQQFDEERPKLRAEGAETEREKLKGEFGDKVQTLAASLASDHEAGRARAVAERDQARAETREIEQRLAGLLEELNQEHRLLEEGAAAERERVRVESDQKLQTIVTHLASDHESDLGQSLADREAARAEARGLSQRLNTLQRKFDEERDKWLASDHETVLARAVAERDQARAETREIEQRLDGLLDQFNEEHRLREEGAAVERERVKAEFDQKLQTIVTHLASDHEGDLGQALADKEAARAEARSLSQRLNTMQRKFDEERDKWLAARNAMNTQLREAEERHLKALEDASTAGGTKAAAQAEIDRLHSRVVELEKVSRSEGLKPRVLIAHPDAELRGTASASLERAGYHVISAADGLEALRVAMTFLPEVVIADSTMPKMDGRELCQLLKSQEKTAHIRVILLMRSSEEIPKGELPPDEILRKPVPVETLKSTLASLLSSRA